MAKLKIGDTIKIARGKDKNREGKIEKIFPKTGRILVQGLNLYKKHVKGNPARGGHKEGIYDIPRPLASSKVSLICPKCKKPTRVGFKFVEREKLRICKKCGREIDTAKKSKKVKKS